MAGIVDIPVTVKGLTFYIRKSKSYVGSSRGSTHYTIIFDKKRIDSALSITRAKELIVLRVDNIIAKLEAEGKYIGPEKQKQLDEEKKQAEKLAKKEKLIKERQERSISRRSNNGQQPDLFSTVKETTKNIEPESNVILLKIAAE